MIHDFSCKGNWDYMCQDGTRDFTVVLWLPPPLWFRGKVSGNIPSSSDAVHGANTPARRPYPHFVAAWFIEDGAFDETE